MSDPSARFTVDVDELETLITELGACSRRLDVLLDHVARATTLLHASWNGEAASAHLLAQGDWRRGGCEMAAALADLRRVSDVAHRNYTAAASNNVRMWQALR